MDKYDSANDHYCYSGTATLKNRLNIKCIEELEKAEREVTVNRQITAVQSTTF